ncbi:DUF7004 family protein [Rummeliibacillus sp. TYF005]|uniref:DUF7004 family protein n=1 Tax=Rummeliibacillus sp. TYF005 TaxID=2058214 RepID=UPI000F53C422|nr:hypothetical protein [Rummeliibacillus sp. TYF005]RPJ97224.1 hypothetical protein CW357_00710 [Rummeliibacillus sp. TYF005]
MVLVKRYEDGTELSRDKGNFDEWCIYINGRAPYDRDYLGSLHKLGQTCGMDKVYNEFLNLYNLTGREVEERILNNVIPEIATNLENNYFNNLEIQKLFGTLYLVMLAEQNRMLANGVETKVGKRIKGLAVYQLFYEGYSVEQACNFSIGRPWREIANLCDERGLRR